MLQEFCYQHDIDILLLQEVMHNNFDILPQYNKYINVGIEQRGTAIFTKDHIRLENLHQLPTGRGIAGRYKNLYIINVYAPSGAEKKERNDFCITDLPFLLQHALVNTILGGDFNCVLRATDCTGTPNTSKPLELLIKGCGLIDAWNSDRKLMGYTHYTNKGATRIDRIYMTNTVHQNKIATTTLVAAFSNHHAVKLQIRRTTTNPQWGRPSWKLNTKLLQASDVHTELRQLWERWHAKQKYYQSTDQWWERCAKYEIKGFFQRIGKEIAHTKKFSSNFIIGAYMICCKTRSNLRR
jgi:exonuclease III